MKTWMIKTRMTCRVISLIAVTVILFTFVLCLTAFAEDSSRTYLFDLTINNGNEVNVEPGDVISVMLHLKRTDSEKPYEMYAMQDEVYYDESCFKLVEKGNISTENIRTVDLGRKDNKRAYYMNYVSVTGGDLWESDTMLGMFQLEVIGEHGRTSIENKNYLVSTQAGTDSYKSGANNLSIIIKGDMTVRFVTDGGTEISDTVVKYADLLQRPTDPEKKGYTFSGWYKDAGCTEQWNFETDSVEEDVTLYAKWEKNPISPIVWIAPAVVVVAVVLLLIFKRKKLNKN